MARSPGIPITGTRATIYAPTESVATWRIVYIDRATGKRRTTTGGNSRETAEAKARALSGEYVEGWKAGENPPTLSEAVELWLAANRSEWSSRTYDHYAYFAAKFTDLYGDRPITHISPKDVAVIDLSQQSRGQQQKARTLLRGILSHSSGWVSKERAEQVARGIVLSGNSSGKRNRRISRGDIPSSKLVAALIITASHTLQEGPLRKVGGIEAGSMSIHPGTGLTSPLSDVFLSGLPQNITDTHRRGIPKHYKDPAGRRNSETLELASRYRQIALATALGAGGGLRIGEVLALRVRHFLEAAQATLIGSLGWELGAVNSDGSLNYAGVLDVSEQASQASKGKIWITGTKGVSKSRTVHLPAFLPNWNGFGIRDQRATIAQTLPRFADPNLSLWQASEEEAVLLWREGFTPLSLLLWQRLRELWNDPAIRSMPVGPRVKEYRELLLFPTRNKARKGRDGTAHVQIDPGWRKSIRIVEGTGTYQAQSNYAKLTNPLYDFVAEQMDEWPEHRTNSENRKGWTHHGLRHWAVSTRIKAGVPLPLIAREMGHHDASFTLERYGHVLDGGIGAAGFEF